MHSLHASRSLSCHVGRANHPGLGKNSLVNLVQCPIKAGVLGSVDSAAEIRLLLCSTPFDPTVGGGNTGRPEIRVHLSDEHRGVIRAPLKFLKFGRKIGAGEMAGDHLPDVRNFKCLCTG